ncbi:unnamed protein product [Plutella xylostella]|uniref:Anoctamin n=1 Tax=Plutella xylostella TaxID=51655 RepID=A0A8S4G5D9_PLUXY|nr:unnamed protein product [Plutella xylostella]
MHAGPYQLVIKSMHLVELPPSPHVEGGNEERTFLVGGLPDSMLLWLLQKLRGSQPRLRVCVRQHASVQCSAFYITADDDVLLQTAEEIHLTKQLKPEFGGGYKEFTVRDMHCFQKGSSASELLNSGERAALVKRVLESARAQPGEEDALRPALELRLRQAICECVLLHTGCLNCVRAAQLGRARGPREAGAGVCARAARRGGRAAARARAEGVSTASELLNSGERAALVKRVLESARAQPGEEDALRPALELRLRQAILPACVSKGVVSNMFPLHDRKALEVLRKKWVKQFFAPQPLDEICDYFGVKIAMYFAWLGHYTRSLIAPAVVGFLFWIWLGVANENWRDIAYVLFSIFNVLWACVYLETWKRRSNVLAYKWGTLDQRDELLVEPRPQFQGEMTISPVTGKPEPTWPAWRRRLWRHAVSLPVMCVCVCACAHVTLAALTVQEWWENHIVYFSWLPRAILAIIIAVEEEVYGRIARWLNDKENYRLETKYENHLIVKIALFQFVNSFMSLFYLAFYVQDMEKLKEQLAVLLITRQIIGNLKESALPYLIENLRLAKICVDVFGALSPSKMPTSAQLTELFEKKTDSSGDVPENSIFNTSDKDERRDSEPVVGQKVIHQAELESQLFKDVPENLVLNTSDKDERRDSEPVVGQKVIHQAELESQLFKYEGTFAEYLEMLTQLGHVVLFSSAFPLAGACALLNNAAEIRADAFKLCHVAQRPFPAPVSSVGSWQSALLNNAAEIRADAFKLCHVAQRPFPAPVSSVGSWQVTSEVD